MTKWTEIEIDFKDKTLFGNDAAEEEEENIFTKYVIEPDITSEFISKDNKIKVVRAYKGEGKSALLRLTKNKLEKDENNLVINNTASALSPIVDSTDSDEWTRKWKERLLKLVANEIGNNIGFAYTDDAITLVEEAEDNGFKSRSFVSTITDRLIISKNPITKVRKGSANPEKILKRWLKDGAHVWMIIDDIDQNFQNTEKNRIKVASFFTACRQISIAIPEIKFRVSVRPNVWKIIKREYEALSHVEQNIHDLKWSDDDIEILIAKRIEGYLKRTGKWTKAEKVLSKGIVRQRQQLVSLIFEDPMPWGQNRKRPVKIVLSTLSRHRPRWLIELCKKASEKASSTKILFSDIDSILEDFGKRRIDDTVAEFKSQCPEIEELLSAFAQQDERYSTADLLTTIKNRILQGVNIRIEGVLGTPSHKEVAHFLFHIGFLTARKEYEDESYDHITYEQEPTLLKSKTNIDQGVSWEIHPVFRQALSLKNVQTSRQKKKKR
jgi:hypothetical protein